MDDREFLVWILHQAESSNSLEWEHVVRLKRLAEYADTPKPVVWTGAVDVHVVKRAVDRARKIMERKGDEE